MEEQIKTLQSLITANEAEKTRTPYLEVARGCLREALANSQQHVKALAAMKAASAPAQAPEAAPGATAAQEPAAQPATTE